MRTCITTAYSQAGIYLGRAGIKLTDLETSRFEETQVVEYEALELSSKVGGG
jgi:hypothetical protein